MSVQADPSEPVINIRFEALGRETSLVQSYRIESSYTVSTDGFDFVLYDTNRQNLLGLEMQPVEILINDSSQLLGRIDVTEIGGNGSAVSCSGRDYIADLVECNCDPSLKIKEAQTLADAIKTVASPCGITTVISDDDFALRNVRTGKDIKTRRRKKGTAAIPQDEVRPEPGQGIYEFLNKLVARHGATLQPGRTREEIVISQPDYEQDHTFEIFRGAENSAANNIISASCTRDFSRFPTLAVFTGKAGSAGKDKAPLFSVYDTIEIFANNRFSELGNILADSRLGRRIPEDNPGALPPKALYRLLYFRDEKSKNQEQINKALSRAVMERLKDTLRYRVTVRGHTDPVSGAIWATDTLVKVTDEICGIDETLWVASRTLSYSPGSGATTELELWRQESFAIDG